MKLNFRKIITLKNLIIIVSIAIFLVVFRHFVHKSERNFVDNINKNKVFVYGCIDHSYQPADGPVMMKYHFYFKGHLYEKEQSFPNVYDKFVKNKFLVILDSTNPKKNHMLIFPYDFEKFNLKFPDSLKWVNQMWNVSL